MSANIVSFRYPNLTPGYLGIQKNNLTLNATFYAELFNKSYDFTHPIVFPQRVPQTELFDELILLEAKNIAELIKSQQYQLTKKINDALTSLSKNNEQRNFLNYLNLLLRYGMVGTLSSLKKENLSVYMSASNYLEFKLIKEIAYFRKKNSNPSKELSRRLSLLVYEIFTKNHLNKRIQMLVLNYVIVSAYRFQIELSYENCIKPACSRLMSLIEENSENNFATIMRISVAYRGLAMVNELNLNVRKNYLAQAEFFARTINPNNKLEEITKKENLYTCLQSIAKWHQQLNQFELAKSNLKQMIELDPYDSTAYAELGFLLIDHDYFEEAADHFMKASELGPPGIGMHTYYYAKAQQLLGNNYVAVNNFYKAAHIDPLAISPWLDLIEYYLENQQTIKAKEIINKLLYNPQYQGQLDENEIKYFKLILNI